MGLHVDCEILWLFEKLRVIEYVGSSGSPIATVSQTRLRNTLSDFGKKEVKTFSFSFPDVELRNLAVKSLHFLNTEALSLYLPQLLEAVKSEKFHDSSLPRLLLHSAIKNIRFAHKLYWYDYCQT
jgi:hypothetical protein